MCERTRALNDRFRQSFWGGKVVLTDTVSFLPMNELENVVDMVRNYCLFDDDNDPHQERDFGSFDYGGTKYGFKIDCYDNTMQFHSPNPADPAVTQRVLTIFRMDEL